MAAKPLWGAFQRHGHPASPAAVFGGVSSCPAIRLPCESRCGPCSQDGVGGPGCAEGGPPPPPCRPGEQPSPPHTCLVLLSSSWSFLPVQECAGVYPSQEPPPQFLLTSLPCVCCQQTSLSSVRKPPCRPADPIRPCSVWVPSSWLDPRGSVSVFLNLSPFSIWPVPSSCLVRLLLLAPHRPGPWSLPDLSLLLCAWLSPPARSLCPRQAPSLCQRLNLSSSPAPPELQTPLGSYVLGPSA